MLLHYLDSTSCCLRSSVAKMAAVVLLLYYDVIYTAETMLIRCTIYRSRTQSQLLGIHPRVASSVPLRFVFFRFNNAPNEARDNAGKTSEQDTDQASAQRVRRRPVLPGGESEGARSCGRTRA